jgi:hypothetical protein
LSRDARAFDVDDGGELIPLSSGILLRWDELRFLEFFPTEADDE